MANTPLTDDLVVLCHHPGTGRRIIPDSDFFHLLAGGLLADLALTGRIRIEGAAVHPRLDGPRDDPDLDVFPGYIAMERRTRSATWWVGRLSDSGQPEWLLERAVERGAVVHESRPFLRVFTEHDYLPGVPGHRERVRGQLEAVLTRAVHPDPRSRALLECVGAASRLRRKLFPDVSHRKRRIEYITRGYPIHTAVSKWIQMKNVSGSGSGGGGGDAGGGGDGGGGGGA